MTAVEKFIVDKMSSYVSSGMAPDTAARFTRGELLAIYKGDHWSMNAAGKPQKTPPPEALGIEAAMRKADAGIAEILAYCAKEGPASGVANQAPENAPKATAKKNGLEGMKNYVKRETA